MISEIYVRTAYPSKLKLRPFSQKVALKPKRVLKIKKKRSNQEALKSSKLNI